METRVRGRVYATLDADNDIKYITFYDTDGERTRQIDVKGRTHNGILPHTHKGYEHDEFGTRPPSGKEDALVKRVLSQWQRKRKKLGL